MVKSFDKAEHTKHVITTKAKEVFIQKGYFQASMEDIRLHTGMSKGSIYYHFKSKETLFMYILELYVQDWIAKWNEKSSGLNTAKEKLYLLAELFANDFESPLVRATSEFAGSESADPAIKEKLNELNKMYFPIVREVIQDGISKKEFKRMDIDEASIISYGFLAGVGAICQTLNNTEMSYMYKKAVDVFLSGVGV